MYNPISFKKNGIIPSGKGMAPYGDVTAPFLPQCCPRALRGHRALRDEVPSGHTAYLMLLWGQHASTAHGGCNHIFYMYRKFGRFFWNTFPFLSSNGPECSTRPLCNMANLTKITQMVHPRMRTKALHLGPPTPCWATNHTWKSEEAVRWWENLEPCLKLKVSQAPPFWLDE